MNWIYYENKLCLYMCLVFVLLLLFCKMIFYIWVESVWKFRFKLLAFCIDIIDHKFVVFSFLLFFVDEMTTLKTHTIVKSHIWIQVKNFNIVISLLLTKFNVMWVGLVKKTGFLNPWILLLLFIKPYV
jgi:hypothetical protein